MEVVGVALSAWALPEATQGIAKIAKDIADRIQAYRHAATILRDLYDFGYVYHDSLFKTNVELAATLVTRINDERLKHAAQIQIRTTSS